MKSRSIMLRLLLLSLRNQLGTRMNPALRSGGYSILNQYYGYSRGWFGSVAVLFQIVCTRGEASGDYSRKTAVVPSAGPPSRSHLQP
jgi:hypothetical protein